MKLWGPPRNKILWENDIQTELSINWEDHAKRSRELFLEAKIELEIYTGDIITEIKSLKRGIDFLH